VATQAKEVRKDGCFCGLFRNTRSWGKEPWGARGESEEGGKRASNAYERGDEPGPNRKRGLGETMQWGGWSGERIVGMSPRT